MSELLIRMNQNLESTLRESAAFHAENERLWKSFVAPLSQRGQVVVGYCSIVREHVLSQQHLLARDFDVTAMTLIRPSFEALVRAIWTLDGADEEWILKFLAPLSPNADARDETAKSPSVDAMLVAIQRQHPQWVHESLVELKNATWKPMHSYIHGGIRPVLQSLTGCPEPHRIAVVLNGNGFVMLATNVLQIACGGTPGRLADIQRRFSHCLPPMLSNQKDNGVRVT